MSHAVQWARNTSDAASPGSASPSEESSGPCSMKARRRPNAVARATSCFRLIIVESDRGKVETFTSRGALSHNPKGKLWKPWGSKTMIYSS